MNREKNVFEHVEKRDTIFRGNYLNLEMLKVKLPDERFANWEIVRVKDAVAILLVDKKRNVQLVRQYRPALGRVLLEVPTGLLDGKESAKSAAVRESEEETGYRPSVLQDLITYAHAVGYSTGMITLFLGTELEYTGKIHLDTTEFLEPVCMSFDELLQLVKTNQIIDAKTILCTLLSEELVSNIS